MGSLIVHASERESVRRAVRLPCQVVREQDFVLLADTVVDLSLEGMQVRATTPDIWLFDEVIVSFQAPRSELWMDAVGFVTRIIQDRRPGDRGRTFGIRFTQMDAVDRAILAGKLAGLPPPVPQRALRTNYLAMLSELSAANDVPSLRAA